MKKYWILSLILIVVLAFTACGGGEETTSPSPSPSTVSQDDSSVPSPTEAPVDTPTPTEVPVDEPAPADEPEPSDEPEPADEPEPSDEPEPADEPEPSDEPEPAEEPAPADEPAPAAAGGETLLYSLATDEGFQEVAVGTSGMGNAIFEATGYILDAGSPFITIVAAPGGHNGFSISDRDGGTWGYSADFIRNGAFGGEDWEMDMSTGTYRMTVRGTAPEGTIVVVQGRDNPWASVFKVTVGANGVFEINELINDSIITANIPDESGAIRQFRSGFRVSTEQEEGGPYVDYTIHDFIVSRVN